MIVRNGCSADIPALFDIYKNAFPFEFVPYKRFLQTFFFEPNYREESVFVAEENGTIEGFVIAPIRRMPVLAGYDANETRGYISSLAVRQKEKVTEVGGLLLDSAEKYLISNGKTAVSTGYAPQYICQGIECDRCPEYAALYKSRGYSFSDSYAMRVDLGTFAPTEDIEAKRQALLADGFYVGPVKEEHITSLLDPNSPFSSVSWSYEFMSRLRDCDFERFSVCAIGDEVVAACCFGDSGSDGERFGPFGTDPAYRGRGIGAVILSDCLERMKSRGLCSAWLHWGPTSGPAHHLYMKNAFKYEKHYETYSKKF